MQFLCLLQCIVTFASLMMTSASEPVSIENRKELETCFRGLESYTDGKYKCAMACALRTLNLMDDYGGIDLERSVQELKLASSSNGLAIEMDSENVLACIPVYGQQRQQDICEYSFNFVECLDAKIGEAVLHHMKSLADEIQLPKEPLQYFFETRLSKLGSNQASPQNYPPHDFQRPPSGFENLTPLSGNNQIDNRSSPVSEKSMSQLQDTPKQTNLNNTNNSQNVTMRSLPETSNISTGGPNSTIDPQMKSLVDENQINSNQTLSNGTSLKTNPESGSRTSQNGSVLLPSLENNQTGTSNSSQITLTPLMNQQNFTALGNHQSANGSAIQPRSLGSSPNTPSYQSPNVTSQPVSNIMKIPPKSVEVHQPIINPEANNSTSGNLTQLASIVFGGAQPNTTANSHIEQLTPGSSPLDASSQGFPNKTSVTIPSEP